MPAFTTSDNVTIHYEDKGEGFPLVLVHGWAMSGTVWAFQNELAASFRLITADLRGHGGSSASETDYSFAAFAADLAALFDHLRLERAALLGWSLGAQVALEAIRHLNDRVAALVIVAGTPRFTAAPDWSHGLPAADVRGLALRLRRAYDATLGDFFRRMFVEGELSAKQNQRIVREIVIPRPLPDPGAVLATLDTLAGGDHRQMLAAVTCPSLVIHGDRDAVCVPGAGRFMADHIPDACMATMDGVGHAPFLSRPELFNGMVNRFLREVAIHD
ncbi:MAG: alpha/beta fold hydrolase [Desulfuromonadales bacterium]|nr:MAG: alpha/beta fold hydrolase [Desulfuromonadales bacterium]